MYTMQNIYLKTYVYNVKYKFKNLCIQCKI